MNYVKIESKIPTDIFKKIKNYAERIKKEIELLRKAGYEDREIEFYLVKFGFQKGLVKYFLKK